MYSAERSPRERRREVIREVAYRRRYLVPNLVTLGNMFCGYLAIIYAASDRFEKALIAIALAILLDGLDGRVARKLNATSKFGMEFDSFSDAVSFGVAPALLIYHWAFKPHADEFGVLVTFLFALCAVSRLARFNLAEENLQSFSGMPTPAAAGTVIALVNFVGYGEPTNLVVTLSSLVMLLLSFFMVSTIEFFSIKSFKIQRLGAIGRIMIGLLIALIWYNSKIGFLAIALLYCASGPAGASRYLKRSKTSAV